MKSVRMLATVIALSSVAGAAGASIPPPDRKAPNWTGPGLVCGEAFAVELTADDAASQGWPSVGRIPYSVQTGKGRIDIVELWASSAPEASPESEARDGGVLSPLAAPSRMAVSSATVAAEYLFKPADPKRLPVVIIFYGTGWAPKHYDMMLDRIRFDGFARTDCLAPDAS